MATISVKEALAVALKEMQSLTADELRAEILLHRNGSLAVALREAQAFLFSMHYSIAYPSHQNQPMLEEDLTVSHIQQSLDLLKMWAANDNSYALAA